MKAISVKILVEDSNDVTFEVTWRPTNEWLSSRKKWNIWIRNLNTWQSMEQEGVIKPNPTNAVELVRDLKKECKRAEENF